MERDGFSKDSWHLIEPCSGVAFILEKNNSLIVEDFEGEQVADLFCFSQTDLNEFLSSGKSMDYNLTLKYSTGNKLYSNKSNVMLTIVHDDVGVHDFIFAPCNKDTFRLTYYKESPQFGCYEHLLQALAVYNINPCYIMNTFNIFMNVSINTGDRKIQVNPPLSKQGDKIIFKSHCDLIVGLTACSAPHTNNNVLKPIRFKIIEDL